MERQLIREIKETVYKLEYDNGFVIEISYGENDYVDFYLFHKRYGIKMHMFGIKQENYNRLKEIAENNIDDYIEIYKEEYMEGDD